MTSFDPNQMVWGDRKMRPLDDFDHPNLHRRPDDVTDAQALEWMNSAIGKECAGMSGRATGEEVIQTFRSGEISEKIRKSLWWATRNVTPARPFPTWHAIGRLTIFELARGLSSLDEWAGGYAAYLCQWADKPDRPLPTANGWVLTALKPSHLPLQALDTPVFADSGDWVRLTMPTGLSYDAPANRLDEWRRLAGGD